MRQSVSFRDNRLACAGVTGSVILGLNFVTPGEATPVDLRAAGHRMASGKCQLRVRARPGAPRELSVRVRENGRA